MGDLNIYNRNTTRIKVKIGNRDYKINSDTTKDGVEEFLENKLNPWCLINNEFEGKKHLPYVTGKKSLPILFFGDIESFVNQKKKVITVGLNPSNIEFQSNPNDI